MAVEVDSRHRSEMRDQGFTVFEEVFSAKEMEDLAGVLDGFEARRREELREQGDSGISRAEEITFTDHIAEQDDQVRAFVRRPEFVTLATEFLNTPDVDLYWNQTVFKHPEGERLFPWHQDDAYTRVDPAPYLTLWLAINDATLENGCVSVMPESHARGFVEHKSSPLGLICHDPEHPNQGVPVPVKAGSIVAFWSLTMHKSGPNRSKGIRKAYVIQYAPHGLKYMESGEEVEMMPVARDGKAVK